MPLRARHYRNGRWIELETDGGLISRLDERDGPDPPDPADEWVAPAFWDIQTNGRWGVSFSDPALTVDQVREIVRAQAALGTARLCPTLITAPRASTLHGLRTIAAACEADARVAAMVAGIHLEGPYISPLDGYRGAHPLEAVRPPDRGEFEAFQAASGGRVALMTLAPEQPGAVAFIEWAVASGVRIALGHTAADGPTIAAAVAAGASLSTHLGNGIAAQLPRHPNPIWVQAAHDELWASLIADGHHLGPEVLRVLTRAKPTGRVILVSDASPLAGLPVGCYGAWEVDPSGKIVVAGTPYLAGSNRGLDVGIGALMSVGIPLGEAVEAATTAPARFLGRGEPGLAVGRPANLVRFRLLAGRLEVVETWVDGRVVRPADEADHAARVPGPSA